MDQAEEPSEELIENPGKQTDADDQCDRQNSRRDPLFTRRPRDAPQFGDHASDKVLTGDSLSRFFVFVHQRFSPEKLAGRTGVEPATVGFGGRCATNCATALCDAKHSPFARLLCLAVRPVTAAPAAILASLQPFRRFLLVFLRIVVPALALRARHHDHYARFFLCHQPITNMNKTDRGSVRPLMLAQGYAGSQLGPAFSPRPRCVCARERERVAPRSVSFRCTPAANSGFLLLGHQPGGTCGNVAIAAVPTAALGGWGAVFACLLGGGS